MEYRSDKFLNYFKVIVKYLMYYFWVEISGINWGRRRERMNENLRNVDGLVFYFI